MEGKSLDRDRSNTHRSTPFKAFNLPYRSPQTLQQDLSDDNTTVAEPPSSAQLPTSIRKSHRTATHDDNAIPPTPPLASNINPLRRHPPSLLRSSSSPPHLALPAPPKAIPRQRNHHNGRRPSNEEGPEAEEARRQ